MRFPNIDLCCILAAFALRLLIEKCSVGDSKPQSSYCSPLHDATRAVRIGRINRAMDTTLKVWHFLMLCHLDFIVRGMNDAETTIGSAVHCYQ